MSTHILGLNAYHGDVSAVLVTDGELVAAVEEERLRRIKHCAGFPTEAIRTVLSMAGISGADLTHVAVSRDPRANLLKKAWFSLTKQPDLKLIVDRAKNAQKMWDMKRPLAVALDMPTERLPKIHFVEHHPAHLASAFFVSPFSEAAVCAVDGFGDFVSTSMAHGKANQLEVLASVNFPHSLGMLYAAITQFLGFMKYGDEFKVMGLAPYGTPRFVSEMRELVTLKDGGMFELNLTFFRHWKDGATSMEWEDGYPTMGQVYDDNLRRLLGLPRAPDDPVVERHEDLAASVQAVYEECFFHVLDGLWERTHYPVLCLAGGCAMNSVAAGKIREHTNFAEVFIQPAAGDAGTALGAAFHVWNQVLKEPRGFVMRHAYWGPAHDERSAVEVLAQQTEADGPFSTTEYATEREVAQEAARLIADGCVVGWYQGPMEWGSRALGNRSILADPRRTDMRDLINTKIKFRETFRPFAPSIAEEALADYFVDAAPDPFMLHVYDIREDKRAVIPAVTHVDGSGRLQTVSERTNPLYYRLIKEFEAITGVPVVLNTSFNENEPIVDTPAQAVDCFLRTNMDALVLNNTIVRRKTAAHIAAAST